jgi:hypothetical protein
MILLTKGAREIALAQLYYGAFLLFPQIIANGKLSQRIKTDWRLSALI